MTRNQLLDEGHLTSAVQTKHPGPEQERVSPGEKRDVVSLGDLKRSHLRPQIGLVAHIASERHPSSRCRNLDL
jgi:hypothetical protein